MTSELAAERAADILAVAEHADNDRAIALVAVADAWTRLHAALAASKWLALDPTEPAPGLVLPYDERQLPIVTLYGTRYEVNAWDFESGGDAYDAILHLRKI